MQLKTSSIRGDEGGRERCESGAQQSGARRDGNPGIYGNPGDVDSATYRF